ncbi:MAG: CheY-like chemotaxis protein, partial [Nonlabens sp.]
GEYKSCLITANKLEKEDFQGYTCIIRDITERKQTEELIKARDLAQQSAKMKEQFIASISHEMRTPMNAVLGMSNLVIKTDLNDEQFNYISSIKQSSEILLGIINDILEISTLENGKIEFEYKDFDLFMLLKNLFNVMQYKFKEKDIYFETDVEEGIGKYIKGDKLRLNQILYNLVGNGVKFTDFGHVKLRVKNLNENDSTIHLKFEVEDTGIGIPEDKLHSVFETFTRVRSKDRIYEGTGLGLSISKNLVEQQGGKIQVESELGIGSTFSFDLVFEKGEKPKDSGEKRIEVSKIVLEREINLLLVEDHKMNQIVATKTLQKQWDNINITIAGNGQIAVDLVAKNDYDIILMDIQMPIMDGEEATKYIRTQLPPEKGRIPILAMTAHAHISKDEKYKELGMDDFVLKPFDPQQLFNKIAKYVQQQNNTDR